MNAEAITHAHAEDRVHVCTYVSDSLPSDQSEQNERHERAAEAPILSPP